MDVLKPPVSSKRCLVTISTLAETRCRKRMNTLRPSGFGLEPRKHLRRFDPRKATRGGTFALIALSEAGAGEA